MRKQFFIIAAAFFFVFFAGNAIALENSKADTCSNKKLIDCLQYKKAINSYDLYSSDYEGFFTLLNAAETKATYCKDQSATLDYLNAVRITGNAELNEFFSESVEKNFAQKNPQCLKTVFPKLTLSARIIILQILANPTFSDSSAETKSLLLDLEQSSSAKKN